MRVDAGHSKAANVNAALALATGEVIGIFDADHRPTAGCFERAWRSLTEGADVVQGQCAVRARRRDARSRAAAPPRWRFLTHALLAGAILALARDHAARVGHVRELAGDRAWRVTPRTAPVPGHTGMHLEPLTRLAAA